MAFEVGLSGDLEKEKQLHSRNKEVTPPSAFDCIRKFTINYSFFLCCIGLIQHLLLGYGAAPRSNPLLCNFVILVVATSSQSHLLEAWRLAKWPVRLIILVSLVLISSILPMSIWPYSKSDLFAIGGSSSLIFLFVFLQNLHRVRKDFL